jgi:predicted aspartyl protease
VRGRWILVALLLLAGCVAPWAPAVVIDSRADARLRTTHPYGLFLTTARVGGREYGPFVIDTGANALILDVELARTLELKQSFVAYDRETRQSVMAATLVSLEVGPVVLRNTPVIIMDLAAPSAPFGRRLAGSLGTPFFAHAVVQLDYQRREVACYAPGTYQLRDAPWQTLIMRNEAPGVVARIDGHEGVFLLDTGSNAVASLSTAFVHRHAALEFRDIRRTKSLMVAGERPIWEGTVNSLELGGHRVDSPRVTFNRAEDPGEGGGESPGAPRTGHTFDGVIGSGVMRHFTVVFDYQSARVALLPSRPARR